MNDEENSHNLKKTESDHKKKITIHNRRKFDLAKIRGQRRSQGVVYRNTANLRVAPRKRIRMRKNSSSVSSIPRIFSKRYKVSEEIGAGGSASIFKARDLFLGTDVAIKLLPKGLLAERATQERFKNEARIAMQLAHENIARLFHFDIEKGRMYLVMEYVQGKDFRTIIEESAPIDVETVLDIAHSLSMALSYAHRYGIYHRDLKPENIMLSDGGRLKVIDFGTARGITQRRLKTEGEYLEGTPTYAAPEQFQNHNKPNVASDIYSMAAFLQELLTAVPVYPLDITPEEAIQEEPAPMPDYVPVPVQEVISRALDTDPWNRWSSATEFYRQLKEAVAESES
jgi:serine/threonine-protein kinase